MIEITPIYQKDAETAYREFFDKEFISQRLGKPGHWLGAGAEFMQLNKLVKLTPFQNLINGRSPDGQKALGAEHGNPGVEVAWRLDLSAPKSLSVLWALAPARTRTHIERAQTAAAESAVMHFEQKMELSVPPWEHTPMPLFASFRYGADKNQMPQLHTTVFMLNAGVRPDGVVERFKTEQIMEHQGLLKAVYEKELEQSLVQRLGPVLPPPGTDWQPFGVPRDLCSKMSLNSVVSEKGNSEKLLNGELFAHWRRQATEFGWGPIRAEIFLRTAQAAMALEKLRGKAASHAHEEPHSEQKVIEFEKRLVLNPKKENHLEESQIDKSKENQMMHSH